MLVDVATLTGGVIVALGNETTGVMTNNDELYAQFKEASEECGEMIWYRQSPKKIKTSKKQQNG